MVSDVAAGPAAYALCQAGCAAAAGVTGPFGMLYLLEYFEHMFNVQASLRTQSAKLVVQLHSLPLRLSNTG